jgi:mono/diheme cytochrome c family protein
MRGTTLSFTVLVGLLLLATTTEAVGRAATHQSASLWYTKAQAYRGERLFSQKCAACHTFDGADPPRTLRGPAFLARWNTVNDLYALISQAMPADKILSMEESQYRDVLAYILRQNKFKAGQIELKSQDQTMKDMHLHAADHSPSSIGQTVDTQGYYSEAQAERGSKYFEGSCSMCHTAEPKTHPPGQLSDPEFNNDPTYASASLIKSGGITLGQQHVRLHLSGPAVIRQFPSVGAFLKRIKFTMPAHFPNGLSDDTYLDIVAFLLRSNGLSPGSKNLPADPRALASMPLVEPGFTPLFNGKDFSGFQFLLGTGCNAPPQGCGSDKPGSTFWIESGEIHTSGHPHGYMYTAKKYLNFVLRFEYRFTPIDGIGPEDPNYANSGYLLFISDNVVWPKSLEIEAFGVIQLRPIGIANTPTYTYDADAAKRLERPIGQWNEVELISRAGTVTASLNGSKVSYVTRHEFTTPGYIGFQAEGGQIAWRNLQIMRQ